MKAARRPPRRSNGGRAATFVLAVLPLSAAAWAGTGFSGESALAYTKKAVAAGPRYPGSEGHRTVQVWLRAELKKLGCEMMEDAFTAETPRGPIRMTNFIARLPGRSGRAIVFSGHYDTKYLPDVRFVGANDAGSSTGFLLEMARVLAGKPRVHDVYLVWFDGEEAFGQWSREDGVYGSRHLAKVWKDNGTLSRVNALINVDMIGDRDLGILREYYSTPSLVRLIWETAGELGYGRHFLTQRGAVEDDHVPFLRLGVAAVDLIDFEYGEGNAYWHTDEDTLDKLSAKSFQVVGDVLLRVLERLEKQSAAGTGQRSAR